MDSKGKKKGRWIGWLFLTLFAIFLTLGIMIKRVWNQPDYVTFFHIPAAVFFILAGYRLTNESRQRYQDSLKRMR